MKFTILDKHTFTFEAETSEDLEFIGMCDLHLTHMHVKSIGKTQEDKWFRATSVTVSLDCSSRISIERESGSKALGAIRELSSLLLGELAANGFIQVKPTDPDAN